MKNDERTALIYCRDTTIKRLLPYTHGLASLYPVRIAVNAPNIQPSTHLVFLDKKTSQRVNKHSKQLIENNTRIVCRQNSEHLLNPELNPLLKYPFASLNTINTEYDPNFRPWLYVNSLTFMTALNVAILEGCTSAVIIGCSLTQTPHFDAPKNIFGVHRSISRQIEKVNAGLPHVKKFINLYQYTELNSNLDVPNIAFKQLMTKDF